MVDLLAALRKHVLDRPGAVCVQTVSKRTETGTLTFEQVWARAGAAAANYGARGIGRGDIVVLIGTHHLDFYAAWLGAVWLGAIPTVLAEPSVRIDKGIYAERLEKLMERVAAKAIAIAPGVELPLQPSVPVLVYEELGRGVATRDPIVPRDEDLLLLQHSSGTTGLQKGVMLSHGAVARHADAYLKAIEATENDVVATWLPLYHDMGLIACFVTPLFVGAKVLWLSPFEWVSNPTLLLEVVESERATMTWLPNFAYRFLAQRVRKDFDLSSLRAVVNCSEPVTEDAMQAFRERFPTVPDASLHACYALAENVFAVTTSTGAAPRRVLRADPSVWLEEHRAEPGEGFELVSNGTCIDTCEVSIRKDDGAELPARHAGRVLIRSPFLFDGYFRRHDLNAELLDSEGWFDTGDLGFLDEDGHVFITGRRKDLIIVGGKNVYPTDVEQVANDVEGVYPGRVVCFGVEAKRLGTEALIVLAESDAPKEKWPELQRAIKRQTSTRLDVDVADARIVKRKTLRKSTSGKLARGGNREWYLEGRFGPPPAHLGG